MEEENDSLNVILVQWTKQNLTKGRLVELDENNRLICPMNFVPARAFPRKHVLIPYVGEGVRKVRKADRPALPACPLRIMHMFRQPYIITVTVSVLFLSRMPECQHARFAALPRPMF